MKKYQIEVRITVAADTAADAVEHIIEELKYLVGCENQIVGFVHPRNPHDVYMAPDEEEK
jgi:hypothetical protein